MIRTSVVVVSFAFAFTSCSMDYAIERQEESDSIIASVDHINERLQKNEDLNYRLLCSAAKEGDLTEAAAIEKKKGFDNKPQRLAFKPKSKLKIGQFCRVEVRSPESDKLGSDYAFKVEKGLFYSSTKGQIVAGDGGKPSLVVKIYKVFDDLLEKSKKIEAELAFPKGVSGMFALELVCGETTFTSQANVGKESAKAKAAFYVPSDTLKKGELACTEVKATADSGGMELSSKLTAKIVEASSDILTATMAVTTPAKDAPVDTTIEPAECAAGEVFNPLTEKCQPEGTPAPVSTQQEPVVGSSLL